MQKIRQLNNAIFDLADRHFTPVLALFMRFCFSATLLNYFWVSALTKIGDGPFGIFSPSAGAYAQIFPKQMDAVFYDHTQLSVFYKIVVIAGTWAEFILPLLILVGLMTRFAAIAMIGFVVVQTLTDLFGHGVISHAASVGAWFDKAPDSLILDQRLFWIAVLLSLALTGGGYLSADRYLRIK